MESPKNFTSTSAQFIVPVFYALSFYVFGASLMDSFAMYHTWRFVGPEDFSTMHIESGKRIVLFFVIPTLIMTVFLVLQFWHRHRAVSRKLVWVALICTIIPWLSTAFIQIPIQLQLDHGKNVELLEKLIVTDWIRVIPSFILVSVVFLMMKRSFTQ